MNMLLLDMHHKCANVVCFEHECLVCCSIMGLEKFYCLNKKSTIKQHLLKNVINVDFKRSRPLRIQS